MPPFPAIVPVPDEAEIDEFWGGVALPHQTEDPSVEFVNDVTTADWFAKNTTVIAHLSGLAEVLEEQIANFTVHLRRKEQALARFKSVLLGQNYDRITKSASPVVQDAFIRLLVAETNQEEEFARLEDEVEELNKLIEIRIPRRDQLYARLSALKTSQESARQYLDHAKLEKRLQAALNGIKL